VQENLFMLMLQSVAGLALVLALFAGLVWGLRKFQFRQLPQGELAMRVVQRLAIDTRHSLVEVEYGKKRYLLGISPTGISTVSDSLLTESNLNANFDSNPSGSSDSDLTSHDDKGNP